MTTTDTLMKLAEYYFGTVAGKSYVDAREALRAAIEKLVAERDAALADAEKYRWLRATNFAWLALASQKQLDNLDAAIDEERAAAAARAAARGEKTP